MWIGTVCAALLEDVAESFGFYLGFVKMRSTGLGKYGMIAMPAVGSRCYPLVVLAGWNFPQTHFGIGLIGHCDIWIHLDFGEADEGLG